MDRTIKLLAASSVVMLTMTACAPGYSPYGSGTGSTYNENYGGSGGSGGATKAPVTHSHGGKVHSHALPSTGLRHTHATGSGSGGGSSGYTGGGYSGGNTYVPPRTNYQPPPRYNAGNNSGGVPHSHCGRVHSHPLPSQGLAHTHGNPACPAGQASSGQQGGTQYGGQYGGQQQGNNSNSGYDYAYGNNNNSSSGTNYDYSSQAGNGSANNDNGGYYNYGGSSSGSSNNQNYYDSTQPKAPSNYYDNNSNTNYDYSSPSSSGGSGSYDTYTGGNSSSGSFAPNNYSGGNSYTVKRGDTVFQVMRNTGVYWKDIIRLNNLQAPNYQINPGQVLRLK